MLDSVLERFGYYHRPRLISEFIAFRETHEAAKAAGLSVGDYIDRNYVHHAGRSPTEQTIDGMVALGVFDFPLHAICEIGPGSGRYLQRTLALGHPTHFEIYETATEWRDWLVQQYQVTAKRCDGKTLVETDSESIDLVQCHKVFPAIPVLVTASYFAEMARVVRPGGWVVFDILTEHCFTSHYLKKWFESGVWTWDWSPFLVNCEFALSFFAERDIRLVGNFLVPLYPGVTECLVFRKTLLRTV